VVIITIDPMKTECVKNYLFPTPVLAYTLGRVLTNREWEVIEYHCHPHRVSDNVGNKTSITSKLLDVDGLENLKSDLTTILNNALEVIHSPVNDCSLYITQSWLNYATRDQFHHRHYHHNSLYSAVLYLRTTEGDVIEFSSTPTTHQQLFHIPSRHNNEFNSQSFSYQVKDYMVLIFPSTLNHSVPRVNHNNVRLSLSLNTFITGDMGSPINRTYLRL